MRICLSFVITGAWEELGHAEGCKHVERHRDRRADRRKIQGLLLVFHLYTCLYRWFCLRRVRIKLWKLDSYISYIVPKFQAILIILLSPTAIPIPSTLIKNSNVFLLEEVSFRLRRVRVEG